MSKTIEIGGYPVMFERRRYGGGIGGTTYTWAYAQINGEWQQLGDPWPCLNPPRKEMLAAIEALTKPVAVAP
jgi:hypothetical protein